MERLPKPVFPKVRSADLFWSARLSKLVRENKIVCSKKYNFTTVIIKLSFPI